jgi:hypothetical protein
MEYAELLPAMTVADAEAPNSKTHRQHSRPDRFDSCISQPSSCAAVGPEIGPDQRATAFPGRTMKRERFD